MTLRRVLGPLLLLAAGLLLAWGASWWLDVRRMKRMAVEFVVATRAGDTATMAALAAPEVRGAGAFRWELEHRFDPRVAADSHPRAEWMGWGDGRTTVFVEADGEGSIPTGVLVMMRTGDEGGVLGFHLQPDAGPVPGRFERAALEAPCEDAPAVADTAAMERVAVEPPESWQTTEGSEVVAYLSGGEPRIVRVSHFGEMGRTVTVFRLTPAGGYVAEREEVEYAVPIHVDPIPTESRRIRTVRRCGGERPSRSEMGFAEMIDAQLVVVLIRLGAAP